MGDRILLIGTPLSGRVAYCMRIHEASVPRVEGWISCLTGRFVEGELPEPTLDATSYEIVSVDGDPPILGRLEQDGEGFYLLHSSGRMTRVSYVSEPLRAGLGGLVWVVLDERGGIARYGVLREAT